MQYFNKIIAQNIYNIIVNNSMALYELWQMIFDF